MLNTASARVATALTLLLLHAEDLRNSDREGGQALVEYGLILALVAVMLVTALVFLRKEIVNIFNSITGSLKTGGD